MIYLDTSVALAAILVEDRRPSAEFWRHSLVSSRLIEYEMRVRLNALRLTAIHHDAASQVLAHLALLELVAPILHRAHDAFPSAVRTLDALHLASVAFLTEQGADVQLATYDHRQRRCAESMGIALYPL